MAGGLGDLFNDQRNAPAMLAPGTPAAALSGSPAATLTNLAAISGANAGASLGGALGGLVGLPTANPAAMLEARQAEFAKLFDEVQADGSVMTGDAMRKAGKLAYQKGILTPSEYMKLQEAANTQREKDQDRLSKTTDFVNESEAVKEYTATQNRFKSLVQLANDTTSGSNDFVLIQQGLKVLDPTSITSKGEIDSAKMTARGRLAIQAALGDIGTSLSGMLQFQAGKGQMLTLTANQKSKWVKAIARAVDAQKERAADVYLQGRNAFVTGGNSETIYRNALVHTLDSLQYSASAHAEDAAYSPGTGSETWWGLSERAKANAKDVGDKLGGVAADVGAIYANMGVSGVGATAGAVGEWLSDATQAARDVFNFASSAEDAAGAANTYAPNEYKALNQATIGTGSPILDQAVDIGTGGHNGKAIGNGLLNGAEEITKRRKKGRKQPRPLTGGF